MWHRCPGANVAIDTFSTARNQDARFARSVRPVCGGIEERVAIGRFQQFRTIALEAPRPSRPREIEVATTRGAHEPAAEAAREEKGRRPRSLDATGEVALREQPRVLAAGRAHDAAGEVIGLHVNPAVES